MTAGLAALLAQALLGLIASAVGFADVDAYMEQAGMGAGTEVDFSGMGRTFAIVGLVFSLLWAAFYLGMVWAAWKGHNWARIVLWVFGGLALLFGLLGLITTSGLLAVLGVLQLLLLAAGVVLLALRPSNEWYRAESRRRQGWPG